MNTNRVLNLKYKHINRNKKYQQPREQNRRNETMHCKTNLQPSKFTSHYPDQYHLHTKPTPYQDSVALAKLIIQQIERKK